MSQNIPIELARLHDLLHAVVNTHEAECDCDTVYQVMDQMADLVAAGVDVSPLMSDVHHHLTLCHCCQGEWDALLAIVQAGANQP